MKSNKFPIEINGKRYYVDVTFDDSPAVFNVVGDEDLPVKTRHVDVPKDTRQQTLLFSPGDVVAYLTPAEDIESDPRFQQKKI